MRLTQPGNPANAGRRGRRPLRRLRNEGCGIRRGGCDSLTPHKWCAGCARGIAYVGQRTRGWRAVGNAGAVGQAGRMRLTHPGNHPTQGASGTPPPTVGAIHTLRHKTRRVRLPHASKWCAGCAREIAYVGQWTEGWRAVCIVGKIGQAGRLRLTRPGGHTSAGRRGRRPLRSTAKPALRHETQRMRETIPKRPAHLTAPLKPTLSHTP